MEVLGGRWCIMVAVQGACGITGLIQWCIMVEKVYIKKNGGSNGKVKVRGKRRGGHVALCCLIKGWNVVMGSLLEVQVIVLKVLKVWR